MMDRNVIRSPSNAGIQQTGFLKAQLDRADMIIDQRIPRSVEMFSTLYYVTEHHFPSMSSQCTIHFEIN